MEERKAYQEATTQAYFAKWCDLYKRKGFAVVLTSVHTATITTNNNFTIILYCKHDGTINN